MATAGQTIRAADFPATVSDIQDASGTVTSTSYVESLTGGTACGVAFVAPTSGMVVVLNNCDLVNSGANISRCTFSIRTGSVVGAGSAFLTGADEQSILNTGTNGLAMGRSYPVTGLTPGATYNVRQRFRVGAGTGTFKNKSIIVVPAT